MTIFPTRILFATDGSKDAELAATTTVTLAKETGSELQVVHVGTEEYPPYDAYRSLPRRSRHLAREVLDGQVRRIENLGGAVARGQLTTGRAADKVVELAEEIQAGLIVMGSVSYSVVRHAYCPVLVVRERREEAR